MSSQLTKVSGHHKVALKIEHFYNDEDREFRVSSRKGVQSILQGVMDRGAHVALFYEGAQDFVLTTLIGLDEDGMWLDAGPSPQENKQLLLSSKITFVSVHQQVKVQFSANGIERGLFENNEAFYLGAPDYLLRVQRREFYRMAVPASPAIKCIIPVPPEDPDEPVITCEVPLVDISGGGVGLLCAEHEEVLSPDRVFPDCRISIPGIGVLTVTLEVRNNIKVAAGKNIHTRVGCRFVRLDNRMSMLLQHYINQLQTESMVRA